MFDDDNDVIVVPTEPDMEPIEEVLVVDGAEADFEWFDQPTLILPGISGPVSSCRYEEESTLLTLLELLRLALILVGTKRRSARLLRLLLREGPGLWIGG